MVVGRGVLDRRGEEGRKSMRTCGVCECRMHTLRSAFCEIDKCGPVEAFHDITNGGANVAMVISCSAELSVERGKMVYDTRTDKGVSHV